MLLSVVRILLQPSRVVVVSSNAQVRTQMCYIFMLSFLSILQYWHPETLGGIHLTLADLNNEVSRNEVMREISTECKEKAETYCTYRNRAK